MTGLVYTLLDVLTAEDWRAEILRMRLSRARRLVADATRHAREVELALRAHRSRAATADAERDRQRAEAARAMAKYEERAAGDERAGAQ